VLEAAGKRAEAEAFAADWMQRHPKDSSLLEYLADRDMAAKRYASAAKRYRAALDKQPDDARVLNNLAWASSQLKQPQALEYAERAHELAPDNAAIMDTLGWILTQRGERERGLELLARATELAPDAPGIRLNLAKALVQAGRKEPARKELEALKKLDSRHPVQQEAAALLNTL
jgi:predicted Zn-dependent protease